MKRVMLLAICGSVILLNANQIYGQNSKMESSTKFSSKIQVHEPLDTTKPKTETPPAKAPELPKVVIPTPVSQRSEYLHPGIMVYLNNKWEGSDHLLNISKNIGVYITIVKPEGEMLHISESEIQREVENLFKVGGIVPQTMAPIGSPPLPAFEIEIFVYPIEKGYVACCDGRLLESVVLDRFKMDSNMAFQAITWEKQSLIVSPKSQFPEQLLKNVNEIAKAFVDRFQAYDKIRKETTY